MHVYNVIQAAEYIGCDPKTVRRMLKRGHLTAERTDRGWLAIPGGQVEYAKIKWEEDKARFARPGHTKDSPDKATRDSLDSIGRLESRVSELEGIVEVQAARILSLEKAMSNASLQRPTTPYHAQTDDVIEQPMRPQNDNVAPSWTIDEIPEGTIPHFVFTKKYGINRKTFEEWVSKNYIEVEVRPSISRPHEKRRWMSKEQQEAALAWIRENRPGMIKEDH